MMVTKTSLQPGLPPPYARERGPARGSLAGNKRHSAEIEIRRVGVSGEREAHAKRLLRESRF